VAFIGDSRGYCIKRLVFTSVNALSKHKQFGKISDLQQIVFSFINFLRSICQFISGPPLTVSVSLFVIFAGILIRQLLNSSASSPFPIPFFYFIFVLLPVTTSFVA
jgi:hypothetical protein